LTGDGETSAQLFALTQQQRAIGDLARDFARQEIAPFIERWDKDHTFPRELYGKLNALGLMGMPVRTRRRRFAAGRGATATRTS
jgi:alkylation response protein AidB-like acyl-CoA dehydrogenase